MNRRNFPGINLFRTIGLASAKIASTVSPVTMSIFMALGLLGINQFVRAADPAHPDQPIVSPAEAISRLKEGNGRFTAGNAQHPHESSDERKHMATNSYENAGMTFLGMTAAQAVKRRAELANSQHPLATIVRCSDSDPERT